MNRFTVGVGPDPESSPETSEVEALLLATRSAGPDPDFRDRVLAAMELAAGERRSILVTHRPTRPDVRSRILPEAIAGAAAALSVLVVAWQDGGQGTIPAAPAVVDAPPEGAGDEPPDVHRALEMLDARRDLFASVHSRAAEPRVRQDADAPRLRGTL